MEIQVSPRIFFGKYFLKSLRIFLKILTWTQFLREYFLQRSCKSQHRSDSPAGKEIFRFLDSHPEKEISRFLDSHPEKEIFRAEACQGNDP